MARVLLAMMALLSLTAFAPAPFPKAQRRDVTGISLESFRGTWRAVKFESVTPQGGRGEIGLWFQQVRVQDDQWFYIVKGKDNTPYRIVVDGNRKPATIDFYSRGATDKPGMVGLLKRDGNRVTVLYFATQPQNRTRSFENPPAGWWVLTLEKN